MTYVLIGLPEMQAALRLLPVELRKELRPKIIAFAQPMMNEMRSNASWSGRSRVQSSLRVRLTGGRSAGVSITSTSFVGGLYERPKGFRAPLFGDTEHWYDHGNGRGPKGAGPWFYPAAKGKTNALRAAVQQAISAAVR